MNMKFKARAFTLFLALTAASSAWANVDRMLRGQYIDMWSEEAVYQMVVHYIPASITLAQGIIESGDGNSKLARTANNHFGIKCHSDWQGGRVYHDDDSKGECFRQYEDAKQSFEDHSVFLKRSRYAKLFELKITDYEAWANGLKECGYATSPTYTQQLIKVIVENELYKYDEEGVKHIKKGTLPEGRTNTAPIAVISEKQSRKGRHNNDEPAVITLGRSRNVSVSNNKVKFTNAKEDETIAELANEMDVMPWQLKRYNDIDDSYRFSEGEVIYLQPKRKNGDEASHTVKKGESLRIISQLHGIKLKSLMKYNGLNADSPLSEGQELKLRKK